MEIRGAGGKVQKDRDASRDKVGAKCRIPIRVEGDRRSHLHEGIADRDHELLARRNLFAFRISVRLRFLVSHDPNERRAHVLLPAPEKRRRSVDRRLSKTGTETGRLLRSHTAAAPVSSHVDVESELLCVSCDTAVGVLRLCVPTRVGRARASHAQATTPTTRWEFVGCNRGDQMKE